MFPGQGANSSAFENHCARIRWSWGDREVWHWLVWPKEGKGRGEAGSQGQMEPTAGMSPGHSLSIFHCCFSSHINLVLLYEAETRGANGLQACASHFNHREGLSAPFH